MAFSNLLIIDNFEFTDDGRTVDLSVESREVALETATGITKKYIKATKNKFSVSWDWMPGLSTKTSDKKYGRDKLKELILIPATHSIQIKISTSEIINLTAYLENYSETLQRRDFVSNTAFYNVKMDIREQ